MTTLVTEPLVHPQPDAQQAIQTRTVADYEVCKVPRLWWREPLKRPTSQHRNVKVRHLIVPMPGWVWEKVWEAIPVFGLENIYIYAPKAAWYTRHPDPLVVGLHGGKWHFIAAWNLVNEI